MVEGETCDKPGDWSWITETTAFCPHARGDQYNEEEASFSENPYCEVAATPTTSPSGDLIPTIRGSEAFCRHEADFALQAHVECRAFAPERVFRSGLLRWQSSGNEVRRGLAVGL